MSKDHFRPVLDRAGDLGLFARGGVNQLPMALVALDRMGATPSQVAAFDRHWRQAYGRPPPPAAGPGVAALRWREHIRDTAGFPALQAAFQRHIEAHGAGGLMTDVWAELHAGIGALAYQALIRLAYGLEAAHTGETAAGLAALVTGHQTLGLTRRAAPACPSVKDGLRQLSRALDGESFGSGAITAAMASAAQSPRVCRAFTLAPLDGADLLAAMSDVAVRLYVQTGDVTVLHMVTATHALRIVLHALPEALARPVERSAWSTFLAAYASMGAPLLTAQPRPAPPSWDVLLVAARGSRDEHAIMLTYSCWQEHEVYGGASYAAAAARGLRLRAV